MSASFAYSPKHSAKLIAGVLSPRSDMNEVIHRHFVDREAAIECRSQHHREEDAEETMGYHIDLSEAPVHASNHPEASPLFRYAVVKLANHGNYRGGDAVSCLHFPEKMIVD